MTAGYEESVAVLGLRPRRAAIPEEEELLDLRLTIARLIEEGRVCVTLDLTGVPLLDARGLGELARAAQTLGLAGGVLTVANPNRRVRTLLAITRLDTMLPIGLTPSPAPAVPRPG